MFLFVSWRKLVPSIFTFAALCCGVGSILASAKEHFYLAALLILVALILDGLDGTIARLLHGQTDFGAELDTFVDITAFGTAPAVLIYMQPDFLNIPYWAEIAAFLVVMSGASRLSRFRIVDPYRGQRGYLGLPITVAAALIAVFMIAFECKAEIPWIESHFAAIAIGAWVCVFAMLVLQVSTVRYSKPTKNPWLFIPFAIALVMLFFKPVALYAAIPLTLYGLWYTFISPCFFKRFLAKLPPVESAS